MLGWFISVVVDSFFLFFELGVIILCLIYFLIKYFVVGIGYLFVGLFLILKVLSILLKLGRWSILVSFFSFDSFGWGEIFELKLILNLMCSSRMYFFKKVKVYFLINVYMFFRVFKFFWENFLLVKFFLDKFFCVLVVMLKWKMRL